MKNSILLIIASVTIIFSSFAYKSINIENGQRVNFRIKGTGSKGIFVTIGIGSKPGYGACCSGVSENTTVGFSGEVGDVVYDGKTRRIITKIHSGLEGETINLADYY
ncbi:MAG: hypothetical protein ACK5CY_12135 [Bacteroidia bacterium]|jgi:hypothetical protein